MTTTMPDDAELDRSLTSRFLEGAPEAVHQIDGWIRSAAFPYRRRLSNEWDDLCQDLRLEVFQLLQNGKFRGESRLKTYVWRVVSHSCLDRCRARSRNREVDTDLDDVSLLMPPRPAAQGSTAIQRNLLLRVLEEMSEDCRRLWQMIAQGFSYKEMSAKLGVSPGALRVRVLRCRQKAQEVRERLLGNESALESA